MIKGVLLVLMISVKFVGILICKMVDVIKVKLKFKIVLSIYKMVYVYFVKKDIF